MKLRKLEVSSVHFAEHMPAPPLLGVDEDVHQSYDEYVERLKKRAEQPNDAEAIYQIGCYNRGDRGFRQDYLKANELWLRALSLLITIATSYCDGEGVEMDTKKAKHYYKLAAIGGNVDARYNLGGFEGNTGNMNRAMKHWMISAGGGDDGSIENQGRLYERVCH